MLMPGDHDDAAFQLLEQQLALAGRRLQQKLTGRSSASASSAAADNAELQIILSSMLYKVKRMGLWVTDKVGEARLSQVQKIFDTIKGPDGDSVISSVIRSIGPSSTHANDDGDGDDRGVQVVKGLLSLGLDPDQGNTKERRPSHWCSTQGAVKIAQVLLPCRPDLAAEDSNAKTALDVTAVVAVDNNKAKKSDFALGDEIKVSCKDAAQLEQLQVGHGGSNKDMAATIGRTGTVTSLDGPVGAADAVQVKFVDSNGTLKNTWWYNPVALQKWPSAEALLLQRLSRMWRTASIDELEYPAIIAQLACEERWWAVKNLCRRRAVPEWEGHAKYHGRSAIEWADYHGRIPLAKELRYLLNGCEDEPQEKSIIDELSARMEAMLGEMEVLKEGLALCMGRFTENGSASSEKADISSLELKCASLKEELSSLKQSVKEVTSIQGSSNQLDMAAANKRDVDNLRQEQKDLKQNLEGQILGLKDQLGMMPSIMATTINTAIAGYAAGNRGTN